MSRWVWFRNGVLWTVCGYHLAVGLLLSGPQSWVEATAARAFGVTRLPGMSSLPVARMLGAYMVAFGLMIGLAALDPVRRRGFLTLAAALVLARSVERLATAAQLEELLGIEGSRNWVSIGVLLAFAAALTAISWQLRRQAGPPTSTS